MLLLFSTLAIGQDQPTRLIVHWDKVIGTTKTTPTLQVVVNPPLQRGTPVHDNAFQALHELGADYVRYVPWLPYPKLGVADEGDEAEHQRDGEPVRQAARVGLPLFGLLLGGSERS